MSTTLVVQTSFQLIYNLCHLPDLAEMGGYKHQQKRGPRHQAPGKQWQVLDKKISEKK